MTAAGKAGRIGRRSERRSSLPQTLYRGKDIGSREQLIQTCLRVVESGTEDERNRILPHMSVIRARRYLAPLLKLLQSADLAEKEFAALALAGLGDSRAIEPLAALFDNPETFQDLSSESLETAIVFALGEIGDERAVEALLRIFQIRLRPNEPRLERRCCVLSSLGSLAQQGSELAQAELSAFSREGDVAIRVLAVTELAAAFWHRANEVPSSVLDQMVSLTQSGPEEVQRAAIASLSTLANLGCREAEECFSVN